MALHPSSPQQHQHPPPTHPPPEKKSSCISYISPRQDPETTKDTQTVTWTLPTYLHTIDLLEVEVGEPVDGEESPEGELGDWVAVQLNGQLLQAAHSCQGIDLLQAVHVGVGENQVLKPQTPSSWPGKVT